MWWTERLSRWLRRVDVRLAAILTLLYAPVVTAALFVLYAHAAHETLELFDSQANLRLDELERLFAAPQPERDHALAGLGVNLAREASGFALLDADGRRIREGGAPLRDAELRTRRASLLDGVLVRRGRLAYERPLPSGERILLEAGTGAYVEERAELERSLQIAAVVGVLLVAVASLVATRRALRPLRQATAATEGVDLDRLDARVPVRGTHDDVDRHAAAVNRVLDRLEAGFERTKAFSHDAAHELRTPVNRILNGSEVALLDCGEADRARPLLEMIRRSAEDMSGLIDGLLFLARDGDAAVGDGATRIDLEVLLADLTEIYRPACQERGIRLECRAAGGELLGDRLLLARALANLLDNALRHTPSGGSIRVDAEGGDGFQRIRVSDSGPGVEPGDRERIFDRFVRLAPAPGQGGSGLGLPIARMIARVHGGELVASDSPLGGASFVLRLPALPRAEPAEARLQTRPPAWPELPVGHLPSRQAR